ncbi:MAG: c-type cytochrome [Kofleriaceae bacterium]
MILLVPLAAACGGDDGATGEELYGGTASAALGATGNGARCATCHATTDGASGYSGVTLKNIAFHTSWKGGAAPTLLDAANACVTGWMGGAALTADDEAWKTLEAYLVSLSDPAVTAPEPLTPEVLADVAAYEAAYAGGDATAGAAGYQTFCASCHDRGLQVGLAHAPSRAVLKGDSVGIIAQQVRTSGPPPSAMTDATDRTPGPMPFFEPDELSVQDLKDIIAYVRQ